MIHRWIVFFPPPLLYIVGHVIVNKSDIWETLQCTEDEKWCGQHLVSGCQWVSVGAASNGEGCWKTKSDDDISDQSEEVTYREDGDKNASSAKHTVVNGFSIFGRVLDGLIVAVKPSTVRLNSAGLNDQERQAG